MSETTLSQNLGRVELFLPMRGYEHRWLPVNDILLKLFLPMRGYEPQLSGVVSVRTIVISPHEGL